MAEVRSGLAAQADNAATVDASAAYDTLLIYFDGVGDFVRRIRPLDETDTMRLLARLEAAVEKLVTYGFDGLTAQLVLDLAYGPAD